MNVVVDTNVAIAANGLDTHASLACQLACTEFLEDLVSPKKRAHIILDESGLIFAEYSHHLNYKGQPGVGEAESPPQDQPRRTASRPQGIRIRGAQHRRASPVRATDSLEASRPRER